MNSPALTFFWLTPYHEAFESFFSLFFNNRRLMRQRFCSSWSQNFTWRYTNYKIRKEKYTLRGMKKDRFWKCSTPLTIYGLHLPHVAMHPHWPSLFNKSFWFFCVILSKCNTFWPCITFHKCNTFRLCVIWDWGVIIHDGEISSLHHISPMRNLRHRCAPALKTKHF